MLGCCERGNLELSDFLVNLGNIFAEGGAPPPRSLDSDFAFYRRFVTLSVSFIYSSMRKEPRLDPPAELLLCFDFVRS